MATFAESAAGNYLYHRETDGRFRQVAGLTPPAMTVMKAGRSWGGCFVDFDNDSFLDLYVLSGYFPATTAVGASAIHCGTAPPLPWAGQVQCSDVRAVEPVRGQTIGITHTSNVYPSNPSVR